MTTAIITHVLMSTFPSLVALPLPWALMFSPIRDPIGAGGAQAGPKKYLIHTTSEGRQYYFNSPDGRPPWWQRKERQED